MLRQLNVVTCLDAYLLPQPPTHLLKEHPEDAFSTLGSLFGFKVKPFGLYNAPATVVDELSP